MVAITTERDILSGQLIVRLERILPSIYIYVLFIDLFISK